MKTFFVIAIFFAFAALSVAQNVVVEATGNGLTELQARNDALRNAVEQGCGVRIFSETVVQDFVALKDTLVSESFGLVTGYEVLSSTKGSMGYVVKVRATVTKDADKQWAQMKIILQQKGHPTVMFCIRETLDGQEIPQSSGEYELMNKFKSLGFSVIDRQLAEDTKQLQKQLYEIDQNPSGVTAIVSKRGADLLVIGSLEGMFSNYLDNYGMQMILHGYNFKVKIINTDNAQVVGVVAQNYTTQRNSMVFSRETAGKAGFKEIVGEKYIQLLAVDLLKSWIKDVQEGTEMTLVISNVKFAMRKKVLETLGNLPDLITSFQVVHYRNSRLELRVKSKLNAEELAEHMESIPGLPLEVVELQKNTLEVKYIGN